MFSDAGDCRRRDLRWCEIKSEEKLKENERNDFMRRKLNIPKALEARPTQVCLFYTQNKNVDISCI